MSRQAVDSRDQEPEALRAELDRERALRQQAEARASRLVQRLEHAQAQLQACEESIRYRLGDALVRAARPSLDTLRLPLRLARLAVEGWRRARARRLEVRRTAGGGASAGRVVAGDRPEHLPPFAAAPPELVVRPQLRVALVADEFSWRAWQFEAELVAFTPRDWQAVFAERRPHLLLVESTWSGVQGAWRDQVRDLGRRRDLVGRYVIPEIVAWCRRHDVPTVFYNKEDPPNFDVFIAAAGQFDYVFTSDANCIEDYRKQVGHERVYALPFAAQPRIHNPVLTEPRSGTVAFAGTWYAARHGQRRSAADQILRPALEFGLDIYDRMADSRDPAYRWPDEYRSAVRGALPYVEMLAAYKRYKVFVNINSVADSPTMFSRRVFELLASGTPVVSSYSLGIERLLGADVVPMSRDEQTTRRLLQRLLGDDEYRERLALRGQRKVLSEHTYTHRLTTILQAVGLESPAPATPRMAFVTAAAGERQVAAAFAHFRRQACGDKRLLVGALDEPAARAATHLAAEGQPVSVTYLTQGGWGRLMRRIVETADADWLAALNPADHYGRHYLTDYANPTRYVTGEAIGKACYDRFVGGRLRRSGQGDEYRYVARVHPWTLCLSRAAARRLADELETIDSPDEWWRLAAERLPRCYSADRFSYYSREQ